MNALIYSNFIDHFSHMIFFSGYVIDQILSHLACKVKFKFSSICNVCNDIFMIIVFFMKKFTLVL